MGRPVVDLRGETVGTVEDLIVDVRDGQVLYVIVDGPQRFYTLPIRALRAGDGRAALDMSLAGEIARTDEPHFRRAGRLIGLPLENPGDGRIGTIVDFELDAGRGRIDYVMVRVDGELARFPPSVLAHGRFPPLTRWQVEHPPYDKAEDAGFLRRDPSSERERLHDPRWPRR
jgi:sporulation protein YlmC with PRC-barrel domain